MSDKYYVLHSTEDGKWFLHEYTKDRLEEKMQPDEHGRSTIDPEECHKYCPYNGDLQDHSGVFIIKGELVVPKEDKKAMHKLP